MKCNLETKRVIERETHKDRKAMTKTKGEVEKEVENNALESREIIKRRNKRELMLSSLNLLKRILVVQAQGNFQPAGA